MPIINPININDFSNGQLVHNRTTATLASANWVTSNNVTTQTLAITNMTATATVWVSPVYDDSINYTQMYATDQIIPTEQGADYITFRRYAASSSGDIEINIVWFEPGSTGSQVVVLGVNNWVAGEQTVSIPSIGLSTYVWISPTDSDTDMENYVNSQIYCSAQNNGSLTFSYAGTTPTASIPVNVVWEDMTTVQTSTTERSIFWVTPGTTTFNEISTALANDKLPIADSGISFIAPLTQRLYGTHDSYVFTQVTDTSVTNNNKIEIHQMTVDDVNTWSAETTITIHDGVQRVVHTFDWSSAGSGNLDDGSTISDLYDEWAQGKIIYIDVDSSGGSKYVEVKFMSYASSTYSLEATGIINSSNAFVRLYASGVAAAATTLSVHYIDGTWN